MKSIQSNYVIGSLLNWSTELSRLMVPDSSNRKSPLAGSGFKTEEDHLNIKIIAALFAVMPTYYLYVEMYDFIQIYYRCNPQGQGCQHLKNCLNV